MSKLDALLALGETSTGYAFAYLDPGAKREVRRALLKAVCLPGHQVPFASREMPVARGWGSGGLQVTLSVIEPSDVVKVYDQGDDQSMNAVAIRDLIARTTGVATTTDAREATLIQTRHRIPEYALHEGQVVVFQVPIADPLRIVDARPSVTRRLHAERDYAPIWLYLYEDLARHDLSSFSHSHPVEVNGSYVMSPTPIPKHDVRKLDRAPFLSLFGAGREATVYAVPPYTAVRPISFDDRPFEIEQTGAKCARCGASDTFLVEDDSQAQHQWICSDVDHCTRARKSR
ncbi:MAG TPA: alpha-D-ribose 1-methylphosphonate 5-phosphate C-P-lyase PhnJ [Candidatus Acidoferrales bacterium]|nr:alpha-D-ribose 1-methylphosphonate 5-phosphate C-P-lyase PhnJ [Candidatus Acidoferrales bacterium]